MILFSLFTQLGIVKHVKWWFALNSKPLGDRYIDLLLMFCKTHGIEDLYNDCFSYIEARQTPQAIRAEICTGAKYKRKRQQLIAEVIRVRQFMQKLDVLVSKLDTSFGLKEETLKDDGLKWHATYAVGLLGAMELEKIANKAKTKGKAKGKGKEQGNKGQGNRRQKGRK